MLLPLPDTPALPGWAAAPGPLDGTCGAMEAPSVGLSGAAALMVDQSTHRGNSPLARARDCAFTAIKLNAQRG
eukprot:3118024-Alexandrium_andersonii.AAC.1